MKKMMMKGLCLGLLTLTMSNTLMAADGISLGIPGYGGNGCPSGSASVTLTEDAKSLSIIFDQFIAEAGPVIVDGREVKKPLDRKTCSISIPVHVPQGFSVSVINADYRGYVSLPSQGSAVMTAEYFLAGYIGPRFSKSFVGRTDTDYTFRNSIGIEAQIWSPCGADTNLRVNASMLVKTNRYYDAAMATVDSADFKAGILYQLQWRRCSM